MIVALVIGALAAVVSEGAASPRIVDPANHRSESGVYFVQVEPTERTGAGASRVRFWKEGKVAWSNEVPFTFTHAHVADDGTLCGVAAGNGSRPGAGGDLVFAVIDPTGAITVEAREPRSPGADRSLEDDPRPLGIVPDPARSRVFVRIADPDPSRGRETWRQYSLPSGRREADFDPCGALGLESVPAPRFVVARPLPDRPLLLVVTLDEGAADRAPGGSFALLDGAGNVVWRLDRPSDYAVPGDDAAQATLIARMREGHALIDVAKDGKFSVWCVTEKQRVDFQVVADSAAPFGFTVNETMRVSYVPKPWGEVYDLPELALSALDAITLQPDPAERSFFQELQAHSPTSDGGFAAIDRTIRREYVLKTIDVAGDVAERVFDSVPAALGRARAFARLPDGDWIAAFRGDVEKSKLAFVRFAASNGKATVLGADHGLTRDGADPTVIALVAAKDGGFAALVERSRQLTTQVDLAAFAADGGPRFLREENFDDPSAPFSAKDLAVDANGDFVVLEHVRRALKVFAGDGTWKRTISLADGGLLSFPSGVECAPDGSFLVFDYGGDAPLLRVDGEGATIARLFPRLADGTGFDTLGRNARFAADGSLWTTEGRAFHRLGERGAFVGSIGAVPSGGAIDQPGAAFIDPYGRILVRNDLDGAVHVFEKGGAKLFVARPESGDAIARLADGGLCSDGDGGVLVALEDGRGHVRFDPRGTRVGVLEVGGAIVDARDGKFAWSIDAAIALTLRDENGAITRTIDRLPDGRWFREIMGVAIALDRTILVTADRSLAFFARDPSANQLLDLSGANVGRAQPLDAGDWVVLWSDSGASLLRKADNSLYRARLHGSEGEGRRVFGVPADRSMLMVVELPSLTVRRYTFP